MVDKRKEILDKRKKGKKMQEINNAPMNKDFFMAKNEDGELKYNYAKKIGDWTLNGMDTIHDQMRECNAFLAAIRYNGINEKLYQEELETKDYVTKTDKGKLATPDQLNSLILTCKLNQWKDVTNVRTLVVHKLLQMVNEDTFTGELYNKYLAKTDKVLHELGFELFPEDMEILWPE